MNKNKNKEVINLLCKYTTYIYNATIKLFTSLLNKVC